MTNEEQAQLSAMRAFFERQCGNLAGEGAAAVMVAEALAQQLKAAKARIAELEAANVVPIRSTEPQP